jgi:hypothetical protein
MNERLELSADEMRSLGYRAVDLLTDHLTAHSRQPGSPGLPGIPQTMAEQSLATINEGS